MAGDLSASVRGNVPAILPAGSVTMGAASDLGKTEKQKAPMAQFKGL